MTYPPVGDQWTLLPKETGRAFGLDQNTVFWAWSTIPPRQQ
jgi:hypothetical protein